MKQLVRPVSFVPFALSLLALTHAAQDGPDDSVEYIGRAFVLEADLEAGRAAGWASADATDEELLEAIRDSLYHRLRRAGRFVEALVYPEDDRRFSVVFVGHQDPRIESFLRRGLAGEGRIAYRIVATDADVAGSSLAEERERFAAWCAAHPAADALLYSAVARDEGGPHPAIDWRLAFVGETLANPRVAAEAVPLVRGVSELVRRTETETGRFFVAASDEAVVLSFKLKEEREAALRVFSEAHDGRRVAVTFDARVVDVHEPPVAFANPFKVGPDMSVEEGRILLFALGSEPLPAPLRFVEFSTRKLENVVRDHDIGANKDSEGD